jgi:preprotein translocase YajC subunit
MFLTVAKTTSSGSSFIPMLIIFGVYAGIYYFYLRPRRKKQAAARAEARITEIGVRYQTIGGFVGTVVKTTDEFVTLRSSSGTELDFIPTAIARRFDPAPVVESSDETEGDK